MNNSQVIEDFEPTPQEDTGTRLQAEEAKLLRIIEAIQTIAQSKEWSTLKIEVFDNLVNVLDRELKTEAKKENPELSKLTRLSGELKWAERYSDLIKLENDYRVKLQAVRLKLHGKTE